jgi:hypothetical protein
VPQRVDWLTPRDSIPVASLLAKAEFTTIRSKLIKIAACVFEFAARIHLPTGCRQHSWFPHMASRLPQVDTWTPGASAPSTQPESSNAPRPSLR